MSTEGGSGGRFSALLLEGLDHYRKGKMIEAVRAWEEAYLLEPSNLRAREFLRSALERIHAHMGPTGTPTSTPDVLGMPTHPWLPPQAPLDKAAVAPRAAPAKSATPPGAARPKAAAGAEAKPPAKRTPKAPSPPKADAPTSPWDDGPSRAIPQPEQAGDGASGAWGIHAEKKSLPIEAVATDETEVWMKGARELVALNDFSGACELLSKVLGRKPEDAEARQLLDQCETNLTQMYESKIGTMDARPRIAIKPDEIIWLNLDPRAGFVLAQIDGEVSFDDLYAICGLKRLDTARILCELLEQGVVQVPGREQPVAKRAMPRT